MEESKVKDAKGKLKQLNITEVKNPPGLYHFIKSNLFRVVHVDGAWGGITPQLNIHAAFYNERQAIPQVSETKVDADGNPQIQFSGRDGYVREVELEMIMSIKTAKAVRDWLNDRIAMAEALRADASNSLQENGELPDIVLVPEKKEAS